MYNFFKKQLVIVFCVSFLILSCATTDGNIESFFLDNAINETAKDVEDNLEAGTKVAVLYFSSESEAFSEYIIDELNTLLIKGKKLTIVDRKYLDQIRNEMDLQLSGDVSDESAQRIGHFLGAQSIVTGSAQKVGNHYRLRFNTIKVETAIREAASSFYLSRNDKQAYALLAEKNNQVLQNSPRAIKRSYFMNNGGAGLFVALPEMTSNNISQNEFWVLSYIRSSIDSIFKRYSNVIMLDRSTEGIKKIEEEFNFQLSGMVSDESIVSLGNMRGANNLLVGTITKINDSEYSILLRIINVETAIQNATYTLICSLEQIRDTVALRKLSYELLTQMGVIYTEDGRKAILEGK